MLDDFFNRIYVDNLDMDEIKAAIQPELDALTEKFQNLFNDSFPIIATEDGILRWETILEIIPDTATEDLEFRRGRIMNRLISDIPYTERTLQIIMNNILGEDNWSYELDYRNYQLDISSLIIGKNWLGELEATLEKMIPANIAYYIHIYYVDWKSVHDKFESWDEIKNSGRTWQDILEGV